MNMSSVKGDKKVARNNQGKTIPTKELIIGEANAIVVRSDPDYEKASGMRATLKEFVKEVKASFRPIIKAAKDAHTEALLQEKRKLEPFESALSGVEDAMTSYLEDRRRAEEERVAREREKAERKAAKLEARGKTERANEILDEADALTPIVPVTSALETGSREVIDYEIVNEDALPDAYVTRVPNRALIRATVNARGMDADIPGVWVFVKSALYSKR